VPSEFQGLDKGGSASSDSAATGAQPWCCWRRVFLQTFESPSVVAMRFDLVCSNRRFRQREARVAPCGIGDAVRYYGRIYMCVVRATQI